MRTIKFRGWDKTYKYMNYKVVMGNTDEDDKNYTAHAMWVEPEKVDYKCESHWCNFDENSAVFMQYTGLKDKNGTEIYEGDVLSDESYVNVKDAVRFVDGQFVCIDYPDVNLYEELTDGHYDLEVIGNIYENPDLL